MSWLYAPYPLGAEEAFVAPPIKVQLANRTNRPPGYDPRRATDASVFKPAVINRAQGPQGGIGIQLVQPPRQARKTTSRLPQYLPPPVVPFYPRPIDATFAPQRRGEPKSILRGPAIQTYLAVPSQVVLFPLLGRVPAVHSKLRPPETPPQKPVGPLSVNLTYSRRGKPRSKLSPPAWTRSFGEIKTTLAPQRRGTPKSRLSPPAIQTYLAVPSLVSLFPLTNRVPQFYSKLSGPTVVGSGAANIYDPIQGYLTRPLDRVPAVHSKLLPVPAVGAAFYARPVQVELTYSRRGAPRSFLSAVVYDANIYEPIRGYLTTHDRVPGVRSKLSAPSVVAVTAALYPISVTLAPSRRGTPKYRLSPPTVVEAAFVYGGPKVRITRSRRPPHTVTRLSAPTVVIQPSALYAVSVTLAPSRRPVAKSRLRPPTVIFPFFARKTEITLVRIRPVPTKSRLLGVIYPARIYRGIRGILTPPRATNPHTISRLAPPLVVAYPVVLYPIAVTLAPSRRPAPKSFFIKTPIAFQAVELSGPEVTLVRIRPPRTMWNLGPMGPPAVVYAPLSVNLTYSRRGAPKSFLPQASLYAPVAKAEYDLKITLAPQRRGKPKSFLRPPAVVRAATPYFRELPVTLAPQKRGKAKSFLSPPTVVRYFVARPALVSLAPSRFPRPKSRLLGYVVPAKVFAPIRVTLAPSRFPTPKSRLLPPAVVEAAFIQINPTRWLVKIAPPRVHSRLRPPAVVGAGVYFRGIQVHLAYSVRGKPKSRLSFTAIAIEVCYGGAVCGFDFAAEVCGTDGAATTVGTTTATDNVTGTDVAATVEGASAPGGSVTGDDARREGC